MTYITILNVCDIVPVAKLPNKYYLLYKIHLLIHVDQTATINLEK